MKTGIENVRYTLEEQIHQLLSAYFETMLQCLSVIDYYKTTDLTTVITTLVPKLHEYIDTEQRENSTDSRGLPPEEEVR